MSGLDVEIVFWLRNLSTLDAALIAGVVSGLIIVFSQWYFRRIIHNFKVDVERYRRLDKVAKGDWPEHIRQSARNKLRRKNTKDILQTVLMFLFWGDLYFYRTKYIQAGQLSMMKKCGRCVWKKLKE